MMMHPQTKSFGSYTFAPSTRLTGASFKRSILTHRSRRAAASRNNTDGGATGVRASNETPSEPIQFRLIPALLAEEKGLGVIATGAVVKSWQVVGKGVAGLSGKVSSNMREVRAQSSQTEAETSNEEKPSYASATTTSNSAGVSSEEYSEALVELYADMEKAFYKVCSLTPSSTEEAVIQQQTMVQAIEQVVVEAAAVESVPEVAVQTVAAAVQAVPEAVQAAAVKAVQEVEPAAVEPVVAQAVEVEAPAQKESIWVLAARAVGGRAIKGAKPTKVEPEPEPIKVIGTKAAGAKPIKGPKPAAAPEPVAAVNITAAPVADKPEPEKPSLKTVPKEITKGGRHISMLSAPMGVAAAAFSMGGSGKSEANRGSTSGAIGGSSGGGAAAADSDPKEASKTAGGGGDGGSSGGGGGGSGGNGKSNGGADGSHTPFWIWLLLLLIILVILYFAYEEYRKRSP